MYFISILTLLYWYHNTLKRHNPNAAKNARRKEENDRLLMQYNAMQNKNNTPKFCMYQKTMFN